MYRFPHLDQAEPQRFEEFVRLLIGWVDVRIELTGPQVDQLVDCLLCITLALMFFEYADADLAVAGDVAGSNVCSAAGLEQVP